MPMRSSNKVYTITEYSGFTRGHEIEGYQALPDRIFDDLENLILVNRSESNEDAMDLLSITARRGIGKIITARNYVGVITMPDGTILEILPKIAEGGGTVAESKRILLEMIRSLREMNFRESNSSSLETDRLNMMEIFIRLFLGEVSVLTKQGLRSAYSLIEGNERYHKGKLLTSQHIKQNAILKDHFYVQYEEFIQNRPEHRVIKGTLKRLLAVTKDLKNRQLAAQLLLYFEAVPDLVHVEADLSKCLSNRTTASYERILAWCRLFLKGNSFTAFSGNTDALAILFPMDQLFESFVASEIRRLAGPDLLFKAQDSRYCLFDHPQNAFPLRPDIVLEKDGQMVILDTKWKLLSSPARFHGIAGSDMYQMYAYSKKYQAKKVILIYPWIEALASKDISFDSEDGVRIEVALLDLRKTAQCLSRILAGL